MVLSKKQELILESFNGVSFSKQTLESKYQSDNLGVLLQEKYIKIQNNHYSLTYLGENYLNGKYKKSEMVYKDYTWKHADWDDPTKRKEDSERFSRKEGYEVLYLINKLANDYNLTKLEDYQKLEKMLHDKLPSDIQITKNVIKWIEDNWKNY